MRETQGSRLRKVRVRGINLRVISTQMRFKTMRLDEITYSKSAELNFKNILGNSHQHKAGFGLRQTALGSDRKLSQTPGHPSRLRVGGNGLGCRGGGTFSATFPSTMCVTSLKALHSLAQKCHLLKCTKKKQPWTFQKD